MTPLFLWWIVRSFAKCALHWTYMPMWSKWNPVRQFLLRTAVWLLPTLFASGCTATVNPALAVGPELSDLRTGVSPRWAWVQCRLSRIGNCPTTHPTRKTELRRRITWLELYSRHKSCSWRCKNKGNVSILLLVLMHYCVIRSLISNLFFRNWLVFILCSRMTIKCGYLLLISIAEYGTASWIHLTKDWDRWRACVNVEIRLLFPQRWHWSPKICIEFVCRESFKSYVNNY